MRLFCLSSSKKRIGQCRRKLVLCKLCSLGLSGCFHYYCVDCLFWLLSCSDITKNKHFEGSCELLSKQCDRMSISVISILQTDICPLYIPLTCVMSVPCTFLLLVMSVPCTFLSHVMSIHWHCTFLSLLMFVPCTFLSHLMSIPCTFLSHLMSIPCTFLSHGHLDF